MSVRCGVCGRRLVDPASIAVGAGPVCASRRADRAVRCNGVRSVATPRPDLLDLLTAGHDEAPLDEGGLRQHTDRPDTTVKSTLHNPG